MQSVGSLNLLTWMGNTPLVRLEKLCTGSSEVFVKLENFNPGGSIKSRVALQMVVDAENKGILSPNSGQTLIEPTGGNTGIGLAIVGLIRGYNVVLCIPDNYSRKKIQLLESFGACVVLADSAKGNDCHVKKTKDLLKSNPSFVWLDQLSNQANPRAHYYGTGREIADKLEALDYFVAGVGSGGTITGVSNKLREKYPLLKVTAVQPEGCDILNGHATKHFIQGFAIGMIPPVFDRSVVNEVISVKYEDVHSFSRVLLKKEGLFLGISSCANILAAVEIAKGAGKGKQIVTIAPDGGESYDDFYRA